MIPRRESRTAEPYSTGTEDAEAEPELLEFAEHLVERKSKPLDPAAFHDRYASRSASRPAPPLTGLAERCRSAASASKKFAVGMQYRPEIDGLRAIAVLSVVLFHAGLPGISGGFVGVDIFFVISGYLITSIVAREIELKKFSVLKFYERRARRILPAFVVVLAVCVPFAWAWMLPSEFGRFAESIVFAGLFASNIYFWQEADYFSPPAEVTPLVHTWTLGVEEQFYLTFPIFLLLAWRFGRRSVFYIVLVIGVLSLLASEAAWSRSPVANFYLAPTRAWELLAGSLCAFALSEREPYHHNFLSALGIAAILISIGAYDENTPFPSLYALLPVGGAVLVVLFGGRGTFVARALSAKPLVGIGLISFSAYLWHQPLLAFARIRSSGSPDPWIVTALVCASFLLAALSWKFVEQPFRGTPARLLRSRNSALLGSGAAVLVLVIAGSSLDNSKYFNAALPDDAQEYHAYLDYRESKDYELQFRKPECFYGRNGEFADYDQELCLRLSPSQRDYILVGDSHAAHLWRALRNAFPGSNIMQATASGCRPLLPTEGARGCTALIDFVFGDFIRSHEVDGVILAGRWRKSDLKRVARTVEHLRRYVEHVVFFGPTVEYAEALPRILAKHGLLDPEEDPRVFASRFLDRSRARLSRRLEAALAPTDARFVPIIPHLCEGGLCRVLSDAGEPMQFDYGHFTLSGARSFIRAAKASVALP